MTSTYPLMDSLMIPIHNFLTINEYASISDALKLMRESFHKNSAWQGPHMLIVINSRGQIVGLLTLKNLLRSAKIKQLEDSPEFKSTYVSWYYIKKCHENGIAVREVMRPIKSYTIDRNNFDINTASSIFTRNGINFVPVLDNNQIIGIVEKSSLFYEIQSLSTLPNKLSPFETVIRYFKDIKTNVSVVFSGIIQPDTKKVSR